MIKDNDFIKELHQFELKYGNVTGMDMYDKHLIDFRRKMFGKSYEVPKKQRKYRCGKMIYG